MTEPTPWTVTEVEPRGGTIVRVTHEDGTVADHDLSYLIGRGPAFAALTPENIATAELVIGETVGWNVDGVEIDLAPDAIWDHAHGRCNVEHGWRPEMSWDVTDA